MAAPLAELSLWILPYAVGVKPDTTLPRLAPATGCPAWAPTRLPLPHATEPRVGIVHLGLGNFHRAHQATCTEDAMLAAGGDLGVSAAYRCAGRIRATRWRRRTACTACWCAMRPASRCASCARCARILVATEETDAVLAALRDPGVRIVTLTVTEKGYCLDPATGGLDLAHPLIAHDLADPAHPRSVPGYLAAALQTRRANPFTVLSCDNLGA